MVTKRDVDKMDMFIAFFSSVFSTSDGLKWSQYPELEDHECENDKLPADPEIVRDLLFYLDPYKSIGPDGIYLTTVKELSDVIIRLLLMIFDCS